ncbi:hypothetical protein SAMN00790413_01861 [Deinococcus hopiensis KR-140]|uniref:Uncharacterized protein n=1 Tax=Deinococcus hopiensis KR-140 TaxID=695939 RepID=A0A1W1VII0_9DEIO|nr:hypothetical protein SAMN00790413_01861 [Deinococcus hopiensis KR-140]
MRSAHQELHDQEGQRHGTERETRHDTRIAAFQAPEVFAVGTLHCGSLVALGRIGHLLSQHEARTTQGWDLRGGRTTFCAQWPEGSEKDNVSSSQKTVGLLP